jgi:hypothetical protein
MRRARNSCQPSADKKREAEAHETKGVFVGPIYLDTTSKQLYERQMEDLRGNQCAQSDINPGYESVHRDDAKCRFGPSQIRLGHRSVVTIM